MKSLYNQLYKVTPFFSGSVGYLVHVSVSKQEFPNVFSTSTRFFLGKINMP